MRSPPTPPPPPPPPPPTAPCHRSRRCGCGGCGWSAARRQTRRARDRRVGRRRRRRLVAREDELREVHRTERVVPDDVLAEEPIAQALPHAGAHRRVVDKVGRPEGLHRLLPRAPVVRRDVLRDDRVHRLDQHLCRRRRVAADGHRLLLRRLLLRRLLWGRHQLLRAREQAGDAADAPRGGGSDGARGRRRRLPAP